MDLAVSCFAYTVLLNTPPNNRCLNVESVLNARAMCLATLDDLIVNSRMIGCLINPSL